MKLKSLVTIPPLQWRSKNASLFLNSRRSSSLFSTDDHLRLLLCSGSCGGSSRWCVLSSIGPPPEPFGDDSSSSFSGLREKLLKIQDKVRIFLAVLFWLALFFWGSAWGGRDDSGNKKGPPFRKKFK